MREILGVIGAPEFGAGAGRSYGDVVRVEVRVQHESTVVYETRFVDRLECEVVDALAGVGEHGVAGDAGVLVGRLEGHAFYVVGQLRGRGGACLAG